MHSVGGHTSAARAACTIFHFHLRSPTCVLLIAPCPGPSTVLRTATSTFFFFLHTLKLGEDGFEDGDALGGDLHGVGVPDYHVILKIRKITQDKSGINDKAIQRPQAEH